MKPTREHATNNLQTYFVTSKTWEGRALFQSDIWSRLFFRNLLDHRPDAYLLHEFVLMPDHFHLLISPLTALEKAVQLIKGGFSFRAKKQRGSNAEVWQRGFSDHRIRELEDYQRHLNYIHLNPVKRRLCARPVEYKYSSAYPGWKLDPIPQGLKPTISDEVCGTTKVVPFQSPTNEATSPEFGVEVLIGHVLNRAEPADEVPNGQVVTRMEPDGEVLIGHDFSRAEKDSYSGMGALAPGGGKQ